MKRKKSIIKFILINLLIDIPYVQEEVDHLVTDMQNCSLTYNEGGNAIAEIPNMQLNTSNIQHTKQPKQGPKNLNEKESSYQIQQKGKQTGTIKGNIIKFNMSML